MQFLNSRYLTPAGEFLSDGLVSSASPAALYAARDALLAAGFVQTTGAKDDLTITVAGTQYLTQAQIRVLQNIVTENLVRGYDTCFRTPSGCITSVADENTVNVAKIVGFVIQNGHFAEGKYHEMTNTHAAKKEYSYGER